jgi:hypothetical protein
LPERNVPVAAFGIAEAVDLVKSGDRVNFDMVQLYR